MKKIFISLISILILSFSSISFANEYSLFIKPCKSCEWISYPEPFRLKEQCEIARRGIFIKGMTKCLETT